jgi:hypothetical protein
MSNNLHQLFITIPIAIGNKEIHASPVKTYKN